MHNNLFHVSATALQKSLEKEATARYHEDLEGGNLVTEEVQSSSSILRRLAHWLENSKTAKPHVVTARLKNKIV